MEHDTNDAEFERFCERLEGLKGTVLMEKPSVYWTRKVFLELQRLPAHKTRDVFLIN